MDVWINGQIDRWYMDRWIFSRNIYFTLTLNGIVLKIKGKWIDGQMDRWID